MTLIFAYFIWSSNVHALAYSFPPLQFCLLHSFEASLLPADLIILGRILQLILACLHLLYPVCLSYAILQVSLYSFLVLSFHSSK